MSLDLVIKNSLLVADYAKNMLMERKPVVKVKFQQTLPFTTDSRFLRKASNGKEKIYKNPRDIFSRKYLFFPWF